MLYVLLFLFGECFSRAHSKTTLPQPKVVPSHQPPHIRKVFTLATPNDKDGSSIPSLPSYIVGPRKERKALMHESPRISLHSRMLLEKAQAEHVRLKECLSTDSNTLTDAEVAMLKKQKLRAKDAVSRYMRESARRSSRSAPSPFTIELGAGGFGKVLFGHSVENGQGVAIKVGSVEDSGDSLSKEHFMLDHLRTMEGFVKVHFYGKQSILEKGVHVVLVLDLLGPSLERLLLSTHLGVRGFASETVLFIADQLLQRLESLSLSHVVHGDIQPGNFLMGCQSAHDHRMVHLIDFGLAYMTHNTPGHSAKWWNCRARDHPRYPPLRVHQRDDRQAVHPQGKSIRIFNQIPPYYQPNLSPYHHPIALLTQCPCPLHASPYASISLAPGRFGVSIVLPRLPAP